MAQINLKDLMNSSKAPTYPQEIVQPFRDELTAVGFKELLTPSDVDAALNKQDDKIVLAVVNSVCGCAAGKARPGVMVSMLNEVVPDEYVSVFAGMEKDAVDHFRIKYLEGITPSSPNIAMFKNGKLVHILQRFQVEGKSAWDIAEELTAEYNKVCTRKSSVEERDGIKDYIENKYHVTIE